MGLKLLVLYLFMRAKRVSHFLNKHKVVSKFLLGTPYVLNNQIRYPNPSNTLNNTIIYSI
jgi:hypothetical protein